MDRCRLDLEKKWQELSRQEKREERFKRWLSPKVKFKTPEAEKRYKERLNRFIKAIKMEIPDRVPVQIPGGSFPAHYAGTTLRELMYDYDTLKQAWLKFIYDFDMDLYDSAALIFSGRVYEILGYKLFQWPGHGLPSDASMHQFVEAEYMKADEYDAFIKDPLDFSLRYFLPRTWGTLAPLERLPRFDETFGLPFQLLSLCSNPDFQPVFKAMREASQELEKWQAVVGECGRLAIEAGCPSAAGGIALAPFDTFADMFRGTRGIAMDMYRQPDKLLEALEIITPRSVESAVTAADFAECPMVFIPLHKGADNFMSSPQYERFYWPTFRKLLLGIINEGCVPIMVADGRYNDRLEIIKDLPRASVIWIFEQTDMAKAKEILGDTACIGGNVTAAQLYTRTPQQIKEYCRWLIEVCGKGGGYILTLGSSVDRCDPANLQAVIEAAKEYGVYR
jgi:uroporphyrinogen-III decarboxylase